MLTTSLIAMVILQSTDPLKHGFENVPSEARMRMYWRIFGPAWDRENIDRQLDEVKKVGLGGLVAYFMYPFALDDKRTGVANQKFNSPEFRELFGYAAQSAVARGLRFGVNGGTGWPYGGSTVTVEDSAHKLREVKDVAPKLRSDERLVAQDGNRWYVESPTRQGVKRASYGAEGLVVDHFSEPVLQRWLQANVSPLLDAAKGAVTAVGCDSLEVYSSNWARDLPAEFRKRRGYSLEPHYRAIFSDNGPDGDELRFDYWRTLMELTEERFTKPLGAWADRRGIDLEMEAYGTPPNPMTAFRHISVPTGEHYEWKGFSVQKYVASAAHMARKNIIGSEAWTWSGLPNRLADTLSDIKVVSDMTFLAGCNDLTGVDYPYSPKSAGQPGWQPYYGPTMNENSPQWVAFPGLVSYLNRCQWMLRQGVPVVSVAVYLPVEDALAHGGMDQMQLDFLVRDHFVTGKATSEFGLANALKHTSDLLHGIKKAGLDYDGIDLWAMNEMTSVRAGSLQAGTSKYRAVVLPRLLTIDLKAFRKLLAFVRSGGHLVCVGEPPVRLAGRASAAERVEFASIRAELFSRGERTSVGKGATSIVRDDGAVGAALASVISPQVEITSSEDTVGFVHRRLAARNIYFISNVGSKDAEVDIRLDAKLGGVQTWDPMTGQVSPGQSTSQVLLPARSSLFLVTDPRTPAVFRDVPSAKPARPWLPNWLLTFDGPDAPPSLELKQLKSWTELPGGRYFSGIGTYRAELKVTKPPQSVMLQLNGLHTGAEVLVNGHRAGYVFNSPWKIEIGHLLRAGANNVAIRVGNLPVNRFLGQPDMDIKGLRAVYGNRFGAPEEKALMPNPPPAGLLGPVLIWD